MAETREGWQILLPPASVSFRGCPWTYATCVDDRRKMEDGKLCGKKDIKGRNQGDMGEVFLPEASVSVRGPPWASATCVAGRRKMEDGKF